MDRATVKATGKTKLKDLLDLDDDVIEVVQSASLFRTNPSASSSSSPDVTLGFSKTSIDGQQQQQRLQQQPSSSSTSSHPPPQASVVSSGTTPVAALLTSPINGQFYVIGNPADVLGSTGTTAAASGGGKTPLAPRPPHITSVAAQSSSSTSSSLHLHPKDDRRRATHNEVERRRRDNINTWIEKLGRLIPEADDAGNGAGGGLSNTNSGGKNSRSKGDILARACEYIDRISSENARLEEHLDELRAENDLLRQTMQSNGVIPPPSSTDTGLDGDMLG